MTDLDSKVSNLLMCQDLVQSWRIPGMHDYAMIPMRPIQLARSLALLQAVN